MADYACGRLRTKRRELAQALDGTFTEHQRWMLGQELRHLANLETQIEAATQETVERMLPYSDMVRRLTTIPGVDRLVGWTIVAELGPDMTVFPKNGGVDILLSGPTEVASVAP
jgi:transposase